MTDYQKGVSDTVDKVLAAILSMEDCANGWVAEARRKTAFDDGYTAALAEIKRRAREIGNNQQSGYGPLAGEK